jgi:cyclic 2,3-diphosphoglycerate synthetase
MSARRRAIAIVDGEHYPPVVRAALDEVSDDVVAAVLVGGAEKLRDDVDGYGVPLEPSLEAAVARHAPDVVLDLSDEPVLSPPARFALASRALALGLPYEGPDFRFEPPPMEPVDVPTLAVIGTGKRVGKTAVTGHVARSLARTRDVVVVAMGRGGPPEPEPVLVPPTVDALLELSRGGRHAASDHLETAVVAGVVTVGSRRCGGGLAGAVAVSNVLEGVEVARSFSPDIVLLDGSGAALPPVAAGRRVLVTSAAQPLEVAAGYLNAYRARIADLVLVTMAEERAPHAALADAVAAHVKPGTPVVRAVLRPRPLEPVAGARVAFFCTAPATEHERLARHLEDAHDARVTGVSGSLADRPRLREDLARIDADVFVVELKAAAIDVVAEDARLRGARVVLAANDVVPLAGEPSLDAELDRLAGEAIAAVPETVR